LMRRARGWLKCRRPALQSQNWNRGDIWVVQRALGTAMWLAEGTRRPASSVPFGLECRPSACFDAHLSGLSSGTGRWNRALGADMESLSRAMMRWGSAGGARVLRRQDWTGVLLDSANPRQPPGLKPECPVWGPDSQLIEQRDCDATDDSQARQLGQPQLCRYTHKQSRHASKSDHPAGSLKSANKPHIPITLPPILLFSNNRTAPRPRVEAENNAWQPTKSAVPPTSHSHSRSRAGRVA
jgi:hypothetical protein